MKSTVKIPLYTKSSINRYAFKDQRGVIIVGAYIVTLFFLTVSMAVAEFSLKHYLSTKRTLVALNALQAAEAGADRFMTELAVSGNHQGTNNAPSTSTDSCSTTYTAAPIELVNNTPQGRMTYETCVKNGTIPNEKIVYSTGKVYIPATRSTPNVTRKIRLTIGATGLPPYSVQTANGGLVMSNGSTIAGSAYINGRLLMSNNATIGSSVKPSEVWVAGVGCGSGASYPSICPGNDSNDLSIFMSGSSHIYGDVHSPNMTGGGADGANTRSRMTNGGLIDDNAPAAALPDDFRSTVMSRNSWTSAPASTANCSSGSQTWAAGTHFTGTSDIVISNSCQITVLGDVWIDGALKLTNSAKLIVAQSLSYEPNILIDGKDGFRPSNNSALIADSTGKAFYLTTFWSKGGSCGPTPPSSCTVPTGSNLLDSTNVNTIEFNNSFTAPGVRFYSVWSGTRVTNSTTVGQLIGQKVELNNSGTISFGSASSSGSASEWKVKHYEQIYQ